MSTVQEPPQIQDLLPQLCLLALVIVGGLLMSDLGLNILAIALLEGILIACFQAYQYSIRIRYAFSSIEWTDKFPPPPRVTFTYTLFVLFLLRPTWKCVSKLPLTLALTFFLDMRLLDARRGSLLLSRIRA